VILRIFKKKLDFGVIALETEKGGITRTEVFVFLQLKKKSTINLLSLNFEL